MSSSLKELPVQGGADNNFQKIINNLKQTGGFIAAIGWLMIFGNFVFYLWGLFSSDFPSSLPLPDLASLILVAAFAVVFIILGRRIKNGPDRKAKLYLQVILGLSFLFFVFVILTGGRIGFLFYLLLGYIIYSLISVSKVMRSEEFTALLTTPTHKINKKGWMSFAIVVIVLFSSVFYFQFNGLGYSNQEYVELAVAEAKKQVTFPLVSEAVTWVAITAEPNAVRYHYVLNEGYETPDDSFEKVLIKNACDDTSIRPLFRKGINLEYSYLNQQTQETFFVKVTKSDCDSKSF